MSSINQIVSEIAHSIKQPDSVPVRRAIKLGIIHARNELIRKTYNNHNYVDKILLQKFKLELIDVPDGDINGTEELGLPIIKRTKNKVPRPVRLPINLPFTSVRTIGFKNSIELPFIKESTSRFYTHIPGMCNTMSYDYINEYIYINIPENNEYKQINNIVVESAFEYPHVIETETIEGKVDINKINDDDEFLIPEDMINDIKKLILETWNEKIIRDTNEISTTNLVE